MESILKSFSFAIHGIKDAMKLENNLKIHFQTALFIFIFSYFLNFNYIETSILILTIALVFLAEFTNTIIERVCDFVHPERSESIRVIKDVSAGMVLVTSFFAFIIGLYLFIPKL